MARKSGGAGHRAPYFDAGRAQAYIVRYGSVRAAAAQLGVPKSTLHDLASGKTTAAPATDQSLRAAEKANVPAPGRRDARDVRRLLGDKRTTDPGAYKKYARETRAQGKAAKKGEQKLDSQLRQDMRAFRRELRRQQQAGKGGQQPGLDQFADEVPVGQRYQRGGLDNAEPDEGDEEEESGFLTSEEIAEMEVPF